MLEQEPIQRVPRPKGFSHLKTSKEKYEVAARALLADPEAFGQRALNITAAFAGLGIPTHVWRKEVVESLAPQLDEKKLMLGGLYHLNFGTNEADLLSDHLAKRILNDGGAHPILVKEYNSLISNRVRLAEAFTKMGQAVKEVEGPKEDQHLSHSEIIEILVNDKQERQAKGLTNLGYDKGNPLGLIEKDLSSEVDGTPGLEPIPMAVTRDTRTLGEKPKALKKMPNTVIAPM